MVLVPNPHYFVHAATVNTTGQAAHLLDEVMEKRRAGHKFLVVDITIQGLIQSKDQLGHVITSYPLNASKNRKADAHGPLWHKMSFQCGVEFGCCRV
jgi:hypothetical protein